MINNNILLVYVEMENRYLKCCEILVKISIENKSLSILSTVVCKCFI